MKFTLFFIVCIMYLLTKRYNEYDFSETLWIDFIIQSVHIIALIFIFIIIVYNKEPFIALFCAYVLHKNLCWFTGDFEYENDEKDQKHEKDIESNDESNSKKE